MKEHLDYRWLLGFALLAMSFLILAPRMPQNETFHQFADQRTIAGIPNFWNVVSNIPFAIIGIAGLLKLKGAGNRALFAGVLLTCFGSTYYHWAPSDSRLIWDRLPMTIIFMSFLACAISEKPPARMVALMVGLGVASVIWWSVTNDLRPYAIVKFGPAFLLIPYLWTRADRAYLWAVLLLFGLATAAELGDDFIYSWIPLGGHTIKHFVAELAALSMLRWRIASNYSASALSICSNTRRFRIITA